MAFDPYKEIKNVYDAKVGYGNATTDAERQKYNASANKARKTLESYGYKDLADSISADGADAAKVKGIMDVYGKSGKTATRDYMYSLGKSYGMSAADVDKLISWDNQSGEVSFGEKKIGAPDAVVDGVSYWRDTSVLDNAFNDYAARSGLTKTDSNLQAQHNTEIQGKINQLWGTQNADHNETNGLWKREYEDLKETNPFTTEEAKAILAKYDLAGLQGRDNAVAESAGTNGGNIDSFAAANALRQQAALVGQGQQVVLDAYKQKLDHAKSLLEGMGVYQQNSYAGMQNTIGLQQNESQRLFDNQETARINDGKLKMNDAQIKSMDVDDKVKIAGVTGYAPDEWVVSNNPYMNDDGTIKNEFKNTDFSIVMAKAKENGNTNLYNAAATARFYKIMGDYGKYGQYDDGNYMVPGVQKTQAAKEEERLNDSTIKMNNATIKSMGVNDKATIAGVSGYTPDEWVASNNPYLNDDGTIKNEFKDTDFSIVMAKAKENGNTNLYNAAATARFYRIMSDYGKYGQYDDGNYMVPGAQKTQAAKEHDDAVMLEEKGIASAEKIASEGNAASLSANSEDNQTKLKIAAMETQSPKITMTGSQAMTAMKNGELNESILAAYNAEYDTSYTMQNPPPVYKEKNEKLSESEVTKWVKHINDYVAENYDERQGVKQIGKNQYEPDFASVEFIISQVDAADDLTTEQKIYLLGKLGIDVNDESVKSIIVQQQHDESARRG